MPGTQSYENAVSVISASGRGQFSTLNVVNVIRRVVLESRAESQ